MTTRKMFALCALAELATLSVFAGAVYGLYNLMQ